MGTERRETQTANPQHYPRKRLGFCNHLPGHSTAAAQPGTATGPPGPLGSVGHCQKQRASFSSFSFSSVYSMKKELSWNGRRGPDQCGPTGWVSFCKAQGRWVDSQSGHMPGLQVWSPVGCMQEATDCCFSLTLMFLFLSFSLPSPFS